jgi:hypothetical protein
VLRMASCSTPGYPKRAHSRNVTRRPGDCESAPFSGHGSGHIRRQPEAATTVDPEFAASSKWSVRGSNP